MAPRYPLAAVAGAIGLAFPFPADARADAPPDNAPAVPAVTTIVAPTDLMRRDLLADAQARSAGLGAASGDFPTTKVWGFTQFRYVVNYRDDMPEGDDFTTGFQTTRTRLYFDSKITPEVSSRVRFTFSRSSGEAKLDQAYGNFSLPSEFKIRAGQFGLPLFRDEYISADRQLAVNSSPTNILFNQGQVQGIQLSREFSDWRFWAVYSDGIRSGNTDYDNPKESDWAITGRAEWKIAGDAWSRFDDYTSFPGSTFAAMLGGAFNTEQGARWADGFEVDQLLYLTADVGLEGDGWNAMASGVVTWVQASGGLGWRNVSGFIVQGGFFISEHTELFARFDMSMPDSEDPVADDFRTITAGFNYYVIPASQAIKFTANVLWFLEEQATSLIKPDTAVGVLASDQEGQWALQAQLQLVF